MHDVVMERSGLMGKCVQQDFHAGLGLLELFEPITECVALAIGLEVS
jgi:hypothetical protein